MQLLVNDLSINGQFPDLTTFREAINRIMAMRTVARRFGRELHCRRNVAYAQVTRDISMQQAVQSFDPDQRRAVMQWLTSYGPFWEDYRLHNPDDYLECRGEIVTDTAIGEAAYCEFHGIQRGLVSLAPSSWEFSPVPVTCTPNIGEVWTIAVFNHWAVERLEAVLRDEPAPLTSWSQLETLCRARCTQLTFSPDSFVPLRGHPFSSSAAQRILVLLDTLHHLQCCVDDRGQRTPEGHLLYQDYFTGDRARFSDSSDTEKRDFRNGLTFRHPNLEGQFLLCTWHGKVNTPPLRVHFSWPVTADEPLFVMYVGPKITKR